MSGLEMGILAAGAVLLLAGLAGGMVKLGKTPRLLIAVAGVAAVGYGIWLHYEPVIVVRYFEHTADEAFVACHAPADAAKPPDGNTASKEDMVAAQKSAKAFDSETTAYTTCLDVAGEHLKQEYSAQVSQGEIAKVDDKRIRLHDTAIDKDQAQAEAFNVQLRVFKARAPTAAQP